MSFNFSASTLFLLCVQKQLPTIWRMVKVKKQGFLFSWIDTAQHVFFFSKENPLSKRKSLTSKPSFLRNMSVTDWPASRNETNAFAGFLKILLLAVKNMKHQNDSLMMLSGEKKSSPSQFSLAIKGFCLHFPCFRSQHSSLGRSVWVPWEEESNCLFFFSRKKPQNIQNKNKNSMTRTNDSDP